MITQRQISILEFLQKGTSTASDISKELKVSARTIRNDISSINEEQLLVKSLPGRGYALNNDDYFLEIEELIKSSNTSTSIESREDRAYQVIVLLLELEEYITVDKIAEKFFVDRSTISKDLKFIRNNLDEYDISLVHKPYKGIKIVASEYDIRKALVQYGFFDTKVVYNRYLDKIKDVSRRLKKVLDSDGISLTNNAFESLTYHVLLIELRSLNKKTIKIPKDHALEVQDTFEKIVARDIFKELNIEMNEVELDYLAMHLITKKINVMSEFENCINGEPVPEIKEPLEDVLHHINDVFGLDFTKDNYLMKSLAINYNQMIQRLKFGFVLRNDLTPNIIRKYTHSYLIASEILRKIENNTDTTFTDNEASFIALHIEYAVTKMTTYMKRILVINDNYNINAELIKYKLVKKFNKSVIFVDVIRSSEIKSYDLNGIDFILTTTKINKHFSIPVLYIDGILLKEDYKNIEKLLVPSKKTKDIKIEINYEFDNENLIIELLENQYSSKYGYGLSAVSFSDKKMLKVYATENSSSIELFKLKDPIVYKKKLIDEVAVVQIEKGKSRRTLREVQKIFNVTL